MEKEYNIINPEDKDYADGKLWCVSIWSGGGADINEFYVYASDEQTALEIVVAVAEINTPNILMDFDSVRNEVYEYYDDEYIDWLKEKGEDYNYDDSWFEFATEYLNYIYVDATMQGASQPWFILGDNSNIKEINEDDKDEKVESKLQETEASNKVEEYYVPDEKEHIIWDSEINLADEIDKEEIRDNEYKDYLDTLEDGEEPQSLDDFCDELIENGFFDNYEDANLDDLEENILPEIDKQVNENYLMLCGGYNSNYPDFKPSGKGGTDFEGVDGFKDYMTGFDRVAITSTDGVLGAICGDHDGTVAGQFYTLPDDTTELIKVLGYEDKIKEEYSEEDLDKYNHQDLMETEFNNDMYYGGLDVSDFQQHLDLMKPITDTISIYGQKPESKLQETRIPAQNLIDKYKDTDKVTFKEIKADLDSYSPEASDETINGLLAQVKAGLEKLGFKANETELVKEDKEVKTEAKGILKDFQLEDKIDEWRVYSAFVDEVLGKDIIDTFVNYEDDDNNVITGVRVDYNTETGDVIVNYVDNDGEFHRIDYKLTDDELAQLTESKEVKTESNQYAELRDKIQKEYDEFPIGFAFSDKQFEEQMEKLGLTKDDTDKVVSIGAGGFIRKDDVEKFKELNRRSNEAEQEAMDNDKTGEGYIKDMFDYELANHEYGYTYDLTDTLEAVGLTMEDIQNDERLKRGLELALKRYREDDTEEVDESKKVKTESIHTDIKRAKQKLINKAKKKGGIWENFGQDEVRALEDKYFDERYNNNGVWSAIRNFDDWCMNFTLSDLNENKESKTESVEPEENKKLDLKDRVKYAYENCNYSKRKDMPTVSDIMDYLGLDTYNNKLYNQISDILYELGYDWQLESKQIKSNKEIKTENFKPVEIEENPEVKNPEYWWLDTDTFVMQFDGGVDEDGDEYTYMVEYWADEDTYHFLKVFSDDTIVLKVPEDKKQQIIDMMKAKMN